MQGWPSEMQKLRSAVVRGKFFCISGGQPQTLAAAVLYLEQNRKIVN